MLLLDKVTMNFAEETIQLCATRLYETVDWLDASGLLRGTKHCIGI